MKNDDIISHILEKSTLDEIKAELDAELDKSEVNYNKVAQLTEAISKLTENTLYESQINENIAKINQEYNTTSRRSSICHIYKWIGSLSACFIMAMALNCYTMVSFGENIFETIVSMTKSGFVIDFSGDDGNTGTIIQPSTTTKETISTNQTTTVTELDTTTYDTIATASNSSQPNTIMTITTTAECSTMRPVSSTPPAFSSYTTTVITGTTTPADTTSPTENSSGAGGGPQPTSVTTVTTATTDFPPASTEEIIIGDIIDKSCQELGIAPCFLDYKANLQLENFSYDKNELSTDCYFTFINDNTKLNITIEKYNDKENIPQLLIPSNNSEYHTINSSIGNIYLFDEGSNSKAVFLHEDTIYTLSVYNMSMKQLEDIVISYSPTEQK